MAASQMMTRQSKFLEEQDVFRRCAVKIIHEMRVLKPPPPPNLFDELLHSIFFLGEINNPKYSPQSILDDMLNELRGLYPQPFEFFSSRLPRRSPFSCVLDMIVNLKGQNNENDIIRELQGLIQRLSTNVQRTALVSSTICVSQRNPADEDSVRYYGVSMSTSGRNPGRIIVAASCLNYWDSYIADAVMTYYPEGVINPDFNRTIRLPEQVRCEAFTLRRSLTPMDPCTTCKNIFGCESQDRPKEWAYGHCAEAESLSNLLYGENKIRVQQPHNIDANRQTAENRLRTELTRRLSVVNFEWDNQFYTPQGN